MNVTRDLVRPRSGGPDEARLALSARSTVAGLIAGTLPNGSSRCDELALVGAGHLMPLGDLLVVGEGVKRAFARATRSAPNRARLSR